MTRIVTTPGRPLTDRAKAFVAVYVRGELPAYKCAIAAGYSPNVADHRASMLLKNPSVIAAIKAAEGAAREAECRAHERNLKKIRKQVRAQARAAAEARIAKGREIAEILQGQRCA
jgi:phage terminase small subunit